MSKIRVDKELCVHCGACTGVCSIDCLSIDSTTAMLNINTEKCNLCSLCIEACPLKAIVKE